MGAAEPTAAGRSAPGFEVPYKSNGQHASAFLPCPSAGVYVASPHLPVVSALRLSGHLLHGLASVATIYLPLLNEGTDCWRPVEADECAPGHFQITSEEPDDEEWPFQMGEVVRCRWRKFSNGEGWEAVAAAPPAV